MPKNLTFKHWNKTQKGTSHAQEIDSNNLVCHIPILIRMEKFIVDKSDLPYQTSSSLIRSNQLPKINLVGNIHYRIVYHTIWFVNTIYAVH